MLTKTGPQTESLLRLEVLEPQNDLRIPNQHPWIKAFLFVFLGNTFYHVPQHINTYTIYENISQHIKIYQKIPKHTKTYQNISKHTKTYKA